MGVLEDGVGQNFLVPQADIGVALQHLGVLGYIRAPSELTAGADVLKVEEATVLVALVSHIKSECWCYPGFSPHEVGHNAGYVERQFAFRLLWHLREPDLFSLLGLGATINVYAFRPVLTRPT